MNNEPKLRRVHLELQRVQTWLFAVPRLRAMVERQNVGKKCRYP